MDTPPQFAVLASRYQGTQPDAPPLMSGDVPAPKTDQEAVALIQQSKAMIDANGGIQNISPAMQAHVKTVISALEKYAGDNPKSAVAQKLMASIQADPALQPYL